MTTDTFWKIIERAKARSKGDLDVDYDELLHELCELEIPELMQWALIFEEYQTIARTEKLWAAAYLMNDGCTPSLFRCFVGWLVAQGRTVFMGALRDPETLADLQIVAEDEAIFEEILHVSKSAYFHKLHVDTWDPVGFRAEQSKYILSREAKEHIRAEAVVGMDMDLMRDVNSYSEWLPKLSKKYAS